MRQTGRITKREMKEDKFTTFMLLAKDYVLERWIYFVGGFAALIILVVAISLYKSNMGSVEQQASEVYSRAISEMAGRNYQLAIVDFKTVVDEYGSSSLAPIASFNLANAYFEAKNYAEAKTAFENYLKSYKDDRYFTTSAMAGVAASLAGTGDLGGAADAYREAAEKYPDFKMAGEYYLQAMTYYAKAGNLESARVMYARLKKDFGDSRQYQDGQLLAGEYNIEL